MMLEEMNFPRGGGGGGGTTTTTNSTDDAMKKKADKHRDDSKNRKNKDNTHDKNDSKGSNDKKNSKKRRSRSVGSDNNTGDGTGGGGGADADDGIAVHRGTTNKNNSVSTKDFLFGNSGGGMSSKASSGKRSKTEGQRPSSFSTTTSNSSSSSNINDLLLQKALNTNKSFLPIGGGAVVPPQPSTTTTTNSSNHASSQHHHHNKEGWIEPLSFAKLSKGMLLLGIVRQVDNDVAVFSLPNMWTGYMLRKNNSSSSTLPSSPELCTVLHVHQIMSVKIVKAVSETTADGQSHRRIQVTCMPEACNPNNSTLNVPNITVRGRIASIEDHGFLVDLGLNRTGFLPFDEIEGDYTVSSTPDDNDNDNHESDQQRILNVHRVLDFIVSKKGVTSSVIPLKLPCLKNMASTLSITPNYKPTIHELQPGMLVNALVEVHVKNGICVTFHGGVFRGSIEIAHLGQYWMPTTSANKNGENTDWKEYYTNDIHRLLHKARIIAIDPVSKIIRLSLQPRLLSYNLVEQQHPEQQLDSEEPSSSMVQELPPAGSIIANCTVIRLDGNAGVVLALPSSSSPDDDNESNTPMKDKDDVSGNTTVKAVYVHISKAMDIVDNEDGKIPESVFHKTFAPGTKHTVRILSNNTNLIEGIASGATAPSIVNAHVLTHADLRPGQFFKQVPVCRHLEQSGSVLVDFGMNIKGLITPFHMFDHGSATKSDFRSKVGKVKYAIGAKVDVRVLFVDPVSKKCYLTAKKPIVKAESSSIISSYATASIGQKAYGYISKVDSKGLWVTFFNKVYGRVTARSLRSELGIDNPKENYEIGDVVECRVVNIKKRITKKERLRRSSMGDDDDHDDDDEEHNDDATMESNSVGGEKSGYFRQITLSLKVDNVQDEDEPISNAEADSLMTDATQKHVHLQAGAVIPIKSMRVVEFVNGIEKNKGGFQPGYAVVSVKAKYLLRDDEQKCVTTPYIECKLPYDQLLDEYEPSWIESAAALDEFASKALTLGKKINRKGIVLVDPKKPGSEYIAGTGRLIIVSIRPKFVEYAEKQQKAESNNESLDDKEPVLPSPDTHVYMGAYLVGYINQIHKDYGAFVRFLNGMSGLVPKKKGGHALPLFHTMICQVIAFDDAVHPPKISLVPAVGLTSSPKISSSKRKRTCRFQPGDMIKEAEVKKIDFQRLILKILDDDTSSDNVHLKVQLHCTMAESQSSSKNTKRKSIHNVSERHPFYGMEVGAKLSNIEVVKVQVSGKVWTVDVTNSSKVERASLYLEGNPRPGDTVSGIVTALAKDGGLQIAVNPSLSCHVPPLEISDQIEVLENLDAHYPLGTTVTGTVVQTDSWDQNRSKFLRFHRKVKTHGLTVSLLEKSKLQMQKPMKGDMVIGRISNKLAVYTPPALMLELRNGFVGRCCITELDEPDSWVNMPLSQMIDEVNKGAKQGEVETLDEDDNAEDEDEEVNQKLSSQVDNKRKSQRKFVLCRVLHFDSSKSLAEVSLRQSRVDGDVDEDDEPELGEIVQAYVVLTNKKGCFVRLSRQIEGRAILKEICDGYLPNPAESFPPGRLVVGKVKNLQSLGKHNHSEIKKHVDIDMRESVLVEEEDKIQYEDLCIGSKHKGTVQRIEDYGVFVRIHNTDITGLVHKSECSDSYVKNIADSFDTGDLVKVVVVKKDDESKKVSLSMKASHFEGDKDSDDSSVGDDSDEEGGSDSGNDDEDNLIQQKTEEELDSEASGEENEFEDEGDSESNSSSGSSDDDLDSREEVTIQKPKDVRRQELDTNVGFDWGGELKAKEKSNEMSEDESSDEEEEDDDARKTSHKSRKKQAQRRREELEIAKREAALADGTADENPETAADFERLLAGDPNSSEIWIKFMAFHLTLADIQAARDVANRAFIRIDFRQEKEKLNVWCALLTLERKYGSEESLQETIDRACQHNNPKHVYLRVCEICSREASDSSPEAIHKADEMYAKMCKKFKDKKKVWIAHIEYLLKNDRHDEAYSLSKRALLSLPTYKHVETMCKFAQLVFEFGEAERARTLFDGLLQKYPKRLDIFFVYADKEIKHGDTEVARSLFERVANPNDSRLALKLNDKQMKRFFKKWFLFEEEHGTNETQERVKDAARDFVERISK